MPTPLWLQHVRAGEPFIPDEEFLQSIFAGEDKATAYTGSAIRDFPTMTRLMGEMFGKVGPGVVVRPPVTIDVGFNIEIGEGTFINLNCTLLDTYPITIGRNVLIAPNCAFYPVGHPMRVADRWARDGDGKPIGQYTTGAPIVVEDDVFIGGNVVVTQGVTIGARSMIGAGSVVTRSIPPDVLAAGNPCKVIRPL